MRTTMLLPGLLLVASCARGPARNPLETQAETHIQEMASAKSDSDRELAQEALYGCGPAAIDPIRSALLSQDAANAAPLVATLSAIPDDRVPSLLLGQLKSPLREIRRQALYGLSLRERLPNTAPVLRLASSKDASDREWALYALRRLDPSAARTLFMAAIQDSSPAIRAQGAAGLRRFPSKQDQPQFQGLLKDEDSQVRIEAALALVAVDPVQQGALTLLRSLLRGLAHGSLPDRQQAARIATLCPPALCQPVLASLLHDADPRIRAEAASGFKAAGSIADPQSLIETCRSDPDLQVRRVAADATCRLAFQGIEPLRVFATSKSFRKSSLGRAALAQSRGEVPAWMLLEIADEADAITATRAAVGLIARGIYRPRVFTLSDGLFKDSHSPERSVRRPAVEAMAFLPTPAATNRLTELLEHPDPITRTMAMRALKARIRMRQTLPRPLVHPPPSWLDPRE